MNPVADCTQCQEWEICPFHPVEPASAPELLNPIEPVDVAIARLKEIAAEGAAGRRPSSLPVLAGDLTGVRLLGPDDPEVSDDMIYLDPATGGVVGVPQGAAATAWQVMLRIQEEVERKLIADGFLSTVARRMVRGKVSF